MATSVSHRHQVADDLQLNLRELKARINAENIDPQACYEKFASVGLELGEAFQGVQSIAVGQARYLHVWYCQRQLRIQRLQFVLHPCILDSGLHPLVGLSWGIQDAKLAILPFTLESVEILPSARAPIGDKHLWSWVRHTAGASPMDNVQKLDIDLIDEDDGTVYILRYRGFCTKALSDADFDFSSSSVGQGTLLLKPSWRAIDTRGESNALETVDDRVHWVVLCGV